jgi:hypothetical protein
LQADVVKLSDTRVSVVARGLTVCDLRRTAERECCSALGADCWRLTGEEIVPCMVSLGGRVRLYEGRFEACRA